MASPGRRPAARSRRPRSGGAGPRRRSASRRRRRRGCACGSRRGGSAARSRRSAPSSRRRRGRCCSCRARRDPRRRSRAARSSRACSRQPRRRPSRGPGPRTDPTRAPRRASRAREPLGERRAAGPGADDEQIDLVLVAVARHPRQVGKPAPVRVEQKARVVVGRADGPLGSEAQRRFSDQLAAVPFAALATSSEPGASTSHRVLLADLAALVRLALADSEAHVPARVGRAAVADLVPRPGMGVEGAETPRMTTLHALRRESSPRPRPRALPWRTADDARGGAGLEVGEGPPAASSSRRPRGATSVDPRADRGGGTIELPDASLASTISSTGTRGSVSWAITSSQNPAAFAPRRGEEPHRRGPQDPREHELTGDLVPVAGVGEHVVFGVAAVHLRGDAAPLARQPLGRRRDAVARRRAGGRHCGSPSSSLIRARGASPRRAGRSAHHRQRAGSQQRRPVTRLYDASAMPPGLAGDATSVEDRPEHARLRRSRARQREARCAPRARSACRRARRAERGQQPDRRPHPLVGERAAVVVDVDLDAERDRRRGGRGAQELLPAPLRRFATVRATGASRRQPLRVLALELEAHAGARRGRG